MTDVGTNTWPRLNATGSAANATSVEPAGGASRAMWRRVQRRSPTGQHRADEGRSQLTRFGEVVSGRARVSGRTGIEFRLKSLPEIRLRRNDRPRA